MKREIDALTSIKLPSIGLMPMLVQKPERDTTLSDKRSRLVKTKDLTTQALFGSGPTWFTRKIRQRPQLLSKLL